MIKSIGMEIVAEGVEDEQTAHWLIEQGCDYIQGFFYAKPMPENQYIEFLKSNA
jgi:EAL domain-containing protein (putative c-di-GMP-specific phosphodiesterase class I)